MLLELLQVQNFSQVASMQLFIPFTHDKHLALTTPPLLSNSYKNNHFFYCLRFSSAHCYLTAFLKKGGNEHALAKKLR